MSYILDALRKADSERERGAVPGLHAQAMPAAADEMPRSLRGVWLKVGLLALIGLLLAALAGLLLERDAQRDAATLAAASARATATPVPAPAPAPAQASVSPSAQGARQGPADGAAPGGPQAAPGTNATGGSTGPAQAALQTQREAKPSTPTAASPGPGATPKTAAPAAAAPPETGGRSTAAAPRPARSDPPTAKAAPATPAVATAARTKPREGSSDASRPTGSRSSTGKEEAPEVGAAAGPIFLLKDLPEDIRRELPTLSIGGSVHSKTAADRLLIIHGQVFHEGDQLAPGLTLEQIRLKSAVLRYKGYRYEIGY